VPLVGGASAGPVEQLGAEAFPHVGTRHCRLVRVERWLGALFRGPQLGLGPTVERDGGRRVPSSSQTMRALAQLTGISWEHGRLAHPTIRYPASPRQACGWAMLTIQGMSNRSTHMPNSSPHICFSSGTDTVPPSDSFSQ